MKKNIFLLCVSFLLFTTSCEDTAFDDLNVNPTQVAGTELRLMLPEVITSSMYNEGNGGNRAVGIIMQQFTGLDAQQLQYTDYILGEDLLNNYWRAGLYAGVLRSADVMIKQAIEEGNKFYEGVGKVAMANQYGIATSWFGDIPFSQALLGIDNLQPSYDTQEQVYAGIIAMLDDAISILSGSPSDHIGGDLIYGGDASGWLKTARALKARYLIHQSKRNSSAFSLALSELSDSYQSMSEQANFTFGTANTQNYSLAKFGLERPSTLGIDPRFAEMMDGDPRQSAYMVDDGSGTWIFHDGSNNLPYARNDATVPMISFTEVKFMEAEALLMTGSDADAAIKEAIMASFEQAGIAGGEDYADGIIAGGVDLETIMTEAYKAYYGFAFHETWTNWRRTGIPSLTPSSNGANGFNPSGVIPQRFLYVNSETQTNSENVAAARAAQNGGLLDVPLWAFQ